MVALLLTYVAIDLVLWGLTFYHLMLVGTIADVQDRGEIHVHLREVRFYGTLALVVMLVGGWAWRWAVASGKVGGRPTARFGGA